MSRQRWGADAPISMPAEPTKPIEVDFGGFGFTAGGIAHNITPSEREEMTTPFFAPEMR